MITIKTSILKEMLGKVIKGVTNNKLLPLTSLLGITLSAEDNVLELRTYDGYNHIFVVRVLQDIVVDKDFYAVVDANQFSALVDRTTKDEIKISIEDKYLKVKGNGDYKFDLAISEGSIVEFPELEEVGTLNTTKVELADIKLALDINKPSAATTFEMVSITGCYFGDKIVTTNGILATITDKKIFKKDLLINYSTIGLLPILKTPEITVAYDSEYIIFMDGETTIYSKIMPEINDYPIDSILGYLDFNFKNKVSMNKDKLLKALERLNIFINLYDDNIIKMQFDSEKLTLTSLSNSGVETISYESENVVQGEFEYFIKAVLLKTQLQAIKDSDIELSFNMGNGDDSVILISDSLSSFVIALSKGTMND